MQAAASAEAGHETLARRVRALGARKNTRSPGFLHIPKEEIASIPGVEQSGLVPGRRAATDAAGLVFFPAPGGSRRSLVLA